MGGGVVGQWEDAQRLSLAQHGGALAHTALFLQGRIYEMSQLKHRPFVWVQHLRTLLLIVLLCLGPPNPHPQGPRVNLQLGSTASRLGEKPV
ncbi:hypothetical protein GN956_G15107 [Arapaima gigas]